MASRISCDGCGKTEKVATWRITGPVDTIEVDLCEKDSAPIRYLAGLGRVATATGTATGPRILDFLPIEGEGEDEEDPPPDVTGAGFDGLFSSDH